MVEIRIAEEAGACYGVERALSMVEDAAKKASVSTLGPLIHNPVVVQHMQKQGVSVVNAPEDAANKTLVLRTHGVTPQVEAAAEKLCNHVLDATCPFVKKVHMAAEKLAAERYQVVIFGEEGHPEVEATVPHAPGALVISEPEAAKALRHYPKIGVIVQTTQAQARLRALVAILLDKTDELRVINTICEATAGHQAACAALAREVDVMVVVGGKNSANTTRLAHIASELCPHTYHIEHASELKRSWFFEGAFEGAACVDLAEGTEDTQNPAQNSSQAKHPACLSVKSVGITAGASTPESHIKDVYAALDAMLNQADTSESC